MSSIKEEIKSLKSKVRSKFAEEADLRDLAVAALIDVVSAAQEPSNSVLPRMEKCESLVKMTINLGFESTVKSKTVANCAGSLASPNGSTS